MIIEPVAAHRKYLPEGYRKHKVIISRRAPGPARVASYWSGGSRSYYTLFRNGDAIPVTKSINPLHPPADLDIDLLHGDVLVQTGTFCGKTATAVITYVEPLPPTQ